MGRERVSEGLLGFFFKERVAGILGGVLAALNSRNILFLSSGPSVFSSEAGGKSFFRP
jgi:hypothetical protein